MLNNFIYAKSKAMFEERIAEVPNDAIVFIEDTKEIWTHGTYFDCSTLDPSIIPNLQMEVDELRTDTYTKTESDARFTMLPITYSELVTLRDNSQLIPGQQYRITDYVTTTAQENTKSAGHQFDVIVTADSENTLNEKARAIQHGDDTYFANANLKAWEIWYCLDNDSTKYEWAVTSISVAETQLATIPLSGNGAAGTYTYDIPITKVVYGNENYFPEVGVRTMINSGPPIYITLTDTYTLVVEDASSYTSSNYPITVYGKPLEGKGVIYRMIDENGNDCPYDFKNIMFRYPDDYVNYYYTFGGVNGDYSLSGDYKCNIINKYGEWRITLNNIIFNGIFGRNNYFGAGCYNNYFITGDSNFFGFGCHDNFFEESCCNNSFGNNCCNNSFGNNYYYNSFGNNCSDNFVGDYFMDNSFGNNCCSNKFIQTTSAPTEYRPNINNIYLDNGVSSMTVVCGSTNPMKNIHFHSGVTGTVNINVTNSARQINVYRINYGSSSGVNAVDYGELYKHVTASGNINVYDRHIICDNTSAITLTLPTGFPGAEFYIHKRSAQSVGITLAATGGQYISEGHSSKTTETRATSVSLTSLGTSKVIWDPSANEWLRIYMG